MLKIGFNPIIKITIQGVQGTPCRGPGGVPPDPPSSTPLAEKLLQQNR